MGLLIGAGILLLFVGILLTSMVLRRPLRQIVEDMNVDHARVLFRRNCTALCSLFNTGFFPGKWRTPMSNERENQSGQNQGGQQKPGQHQQQDPKRQGGQQGGQGGQGGQHGGQGGQGGQQNQR